MNRVAEGRGRTERDDARHSLDEARRWADRGDARNSAFWSRVALTAGDVNVDSIRSALPTLVAVLKNKGADVTPVTALLEALHTPEQEDDTPNVDAAVKEALDAYREWRANTSRGEAFNVVFTSRRGDFVGDPNEWKATAERLRGWASTFFGNDKSMNTFVLRVEGPSGAGKEHIALGVHAALAALSARAKKQEPPYEIVDCSLQRGADFNMQKSELFGHMKGAFAGAVDNRPGCAKAANGGVLFIDEFGKTAPDTQLMFLRFLQEGYVCPVGGTEAEHAFRVREIIVLAANEDLKELAERGAIRGDLWRRISTRPVVTIDPLNARRKDIPHLVYYFAGTIGVPDDVVGWLTSRDWSDKEVGGLRDYINLARAQAERRGSSVLSMDDFVCVVEPSRVRCIEDSGALSQPRSEGQREELFRCALRHRANAEAMGKERIPRVTAGQVRRDYNHHWNNSWRVHSAAIREKKLDRQTAARLASLDTPWEAIGEVFRSLELSP